MIFKGFIIIIALYLFNKFKNGNRIGNVSDAKIVLKRLKQGKGI